MVPYLPMYHATSRPVRERINSSRGGGDVRDDAAAPLHRKGASRRQLLCTHMKQQYGTSKGTDRGGMPGLSALSLTERTSAPRMAEVRSRLPSAPSSSLSLGAPKAAGGPERKEQGWKEGCLSCIWR